MTVRRSKVGQFLTVLPGMCYLPTSPSLTIRIVFVVVAAYFYLNSKMYMLSSLYRRSHPPSDVGIFFSGRPVTHKSMKNEIPPY